MSSTARSKLGRRLQKEAVFSSEPVEPWAMVSRNEVLPALRAVYDWRPAQSEARAQGSATSVVAIRLNQHWQQPSPLGDDGDSPLSNDVNEVDFHYPSQRYHLSQVISLRESPEISPLTYNQYINQG